MFKLEESLTMDLQAEIEEPYLADSEEEIEEAFLADSSEEVLNDSEEEMLNDSEEEMLSDSDEEMINAVEPDPVNNRVGHVVATWRDVTLVWGGSYFKEIFGTNCIKIGLPGKLILRDHFQEKSGTSRRPFLLLRIRFPGRPIFKQLPPDSWDPSEVYCHQDGVWTLKMTLGQVPPPSRGAAGEVVADHLYVACGRASWYLQG